MSRRDDDDWFEQVWEAREEAVRIPLSRGLFALVDSADAAVVLAEGKWYAQSEGLYAARNVRQPDGSRRTLLLHKFLTKWPIVDHINLNRLDNRRANLRPASLPQNSANQGKRLRNVSGYKGVSLDRGRRWRAQITVERKHYFLGNFATPEDAARAYDAAALAMCGEYARINFPKGETA